MTWVESSMGHSSRLQREEEIETPNQRHGNLPKSPIHKLFGNNFEDPVWTRNPDQQSATHADQHVYVDPPEAASNPKPPKRVESSGLQQRD